jgi:hypothetical protein
MGKVQSELDKLKDKSGEAGRGINASMHEATGGLMLVEDSLGVRLPRHLNSLIATIPGVGQAFALMLPIAGVAVAIKIVGELIEKHEKAAEAIRKAAEESENAAMKEADQGKALELTNLKLDDQIAKLEHKPGHNYMKEAILETSEEIDRLAATFAADMQKMHESIAASSGWWAAFKRGAVDALSMGVPIAAGFAAMQKQVLDALEAKMVDVQKARQNLAEAPMNSASQQAAQNGLITALRQQQVALSNSQHAFYGNNEELVRLGTMAASTANEIKDLNLAIEAGGKKKVIAGLEQGHANLEPLKQEAAQYKAIASGATKASEATKTHLDAVAKLAEIKDEGTNDPDKKYDAEQAYNNAVYANALDNAERLKHIASDLYDHEYAANAGDKDKQKQLTIAYNAEIASLNRSEVSALDELNQTTLQEWMATQERKRAMAVELSKSTASLAEATAKLEQSKTLEAIKADEAANNTAHALGLESERRFIEEKIALTERERTAKIRALQEEIAAQQQSANVASGAGNVSAENAALAKKIQLQGQLNALTTQYGTELKSLQTDMSKLNSSWSTYFAKMKVETKDLSTQIRTTLQSSVTQFTNTFGNSMAKCIVENKSLGKAVRQEAAQMLEAMISMLTQELEKTIITDAMKLARHLGILAQKKAADTADSTSATATAVAADKTQQVAAAGLAGANMMASFALAPWPTDMGAPAAATAAFATAMSFEVGGKIPGEGPVPIVGHGGETVITKSLTDRVEASERGGNNGASGQHTWNFSPQIHAVDAEGVDRVLTKHNSVFQRHVAATMRRMNK